MMGNDFTATAVTSTMFRNRWDGVPINIAVWINSAGLGVAPGLLFGAILRDYAFTCSRPQPGEIPKNGKTIRHFLFLPFRCVGQKGYRKPVPLERDSSLKVSAF
jgi:hypothetical protein